MKTIIFTVLVLLLMGNFGVAKSVDAEHPSLNQVKGLAVNAVADTHPWDVHGYLRASSNGHFLEHADGTDFFMMADTAFHAPSLEPSEVETYLDNRKARGFNTIVVTADNFDLHKPHPNYAGKRPFNGSKIYDSFSANENYWTHIDTIVEEAAERSMYVILICGWGGGFQECVWNDPYDTVYAYGQWLSNRYKNEPNVMYCVAGEFMTIQGWASCRSEITTGLTNSTYESYLRRIGQGLASNRSTGQLITMHGGAAAPGGKMMSSEFFHGDSWLNFHGNQSWHYLYLIDNQIGYDYNLTNPKPTFNMEACFENASYVSDYTVNAWGARVAAYWSMFNGAFGHTYGHVAFASMCSNLSNEWGTRNAGALQSSALNAEGGEDMQHVKALALSNGLTYAPDQSVITSSTGSDAGTSPDKRLAVLDAKSGFAYIYLTQGGSVTVNMAKIDRENVTARWFDPRTGLYKKIGTYSNTGTKTFTTSTSGKNNDWVLVLEGQ